jgi:UDP:flavonoid glycosyltransferase YjiC (YdhE family)
MSLETLKPARGGRKGIFQRSLYVCLTSHSNSNIYFSMSRILCVWELGSGYGHMETFLPLALRLRHLGHEVVFALRDLSSAEIILGKHGFQLLQAPIWIREVAGLPEPPLNYAEILQRFGFLNKPGLTGMVKAWRNFFELVKPDLLLIDHAPTALLASMNSGIPRCLIGSGFFSPPRKSPTPNMRPWLNVPEQRLVESDQRVLSVINGILADLGKPSIKMLADLFRAEEDFLCTFPELDHYPNRKEGHYWGTIINFEEGGVPPKWPAEGSKKIFVYLRHHYKDFEKIVQLLCSLPFSTLMHAPGLSENFRKKYQSFNIGFSHQPVQIKQVGQQCDLAICHAGHGTTSAMLLIGRPLLMLPMYLEQGLLSQNVVNYGAGLLINPESQNPDYAELIHRLLTNPSFTERALSFAEKYSSFNPAKQVESIARRCEQIIAQSKGITLIELGVGA